MGRLKDKKRGDLFLAEIGSHGRRESLLERYRPSADLETAVECIPHPRRCPYPTTPKPGELRSLYSGTGNLQPILRENRQTGQIEQKYQGLSSRHFRNLCLGVVWTQTIAGGALACCRKGH